MALAVAVSVAACGGNVRNAPQTPQARPATPPPQQAPMIPQGQMRPGERPRVALLLPLSGNLANVGQSLNRAAEMAVFDVAGRDFELVPIDTQGTPDGAAVAAQQAVTQGASLILGPLLASSVQAARGPAEAAGINIISFSTDPAVAGGNVYLLGFLIQPQVDRMVDYATAQGLTRFAALAPQNDYGNLAVQYLEQSARQRGAVVTRVGWYDANATDVNNQVREFASGGRTAAVLNQGSNQRMSSGVDYQAILLPEGGQKLVIVSTLLPYYDIDPDQVQYMGTGLWEDPVVWREPTLRGGWYAGPPPDGAEAFFGRYQQSFGDRPPRVATLGYDAVALAATLARAPGGPNFSAAALTQPNGFIGIDGIFRLLPNGLNDRGLAVLQVEPNTARVISPAPNTFQPLTQ